MRHIQPWRERIIGGADLPLQAIAHIESAMAQEIAERRAAMVDYDKLLDIIAAAYQIAGAHGAPVHVLDVLARPGEATEAQVSAMLPYGLPADAAAPAPPLSTNVHHDPRQMVVVGGQRVGKQALLDLQRDAARYRWLRDDANGMLCKAAPMVVALAANGAKGELLDGEELDAAVDLAMAPQAVRQAAKLKRMENAR